MSNTRGDNARLSSYPVTCTYHETLFSREVAKIEPVHDMSISLYHLCMYHVSCRHKMASYKLVFLFCLINMLGMLIYFIIDVASGCDLETLCNAKYVYLFLSLTSRLQVI